jgi:hypothetical protein
MTGARPAGSRHATLVAAAAALVALFVAGCCVLKSCAPGTLEVRVVDGETPVAGAFVGVLKRLALIGETYPVLPSYGDGRTDARGVVVFENMESGDCRLVVGHDDFVAHVDEAVHVPGGDRSICVVPLRRGVRVSGRVLDAAHKPMSDAAVRVLAVRVAPDGTTSYEDLHVDATTGADGAFLTRAVEPGAPLVLRVHEFRDGQAFVAQTLLPAPRIGVNEGGVLRVRDTVTVLRLDGEPPRDALRIQGTVVVPGPDGAPWPYEFTNFYFAKDGTARVLGLPDGELRWRLVETRLGPAPNETLVGEGRVDLAGPERDAPLRRTTAAK